MAAPFSRTLTQRIAQTLAAYEDLLLAKHRKHVRATRLRKVFATRTEREALEVMVAKPRTGLRALVQAGRSDRTFEQIVLDFPNHFSAATLTRARQNLEAAHI